MASSPTHITGFCLQQPGVQPRADLQWLLVLSSCHPYTRISKRLFFKLVPPLTCRMNGHSGYSTWVQVLEHRCRSAPSTCSRHSRSPTTATARTEIHPRSATPAPNCDANADASTQKYIHVGAGLFNKIISFSPEQQNVSTQSASAAGLQGDV